MPQELDDSQWWLDDKVWLDLLEPLFLEDASQADRAAKLWHRLLAEIESGPEGATHAAICIENALRLTFPFTRVYKTCHILFQVSLGDDFPQENDSLVVLSKAIERVRAALKRASRSQGHKRRRGSSR